MSYQRKDEADGSDAEYSKMDEEPEPFYLWPLLRIVFGIIILGLSIAEVVLLSQIWTKEYNRLADITFDVPTPVKYYLYNMTSNQYQGNRAFCWGFSTIAALEQSYYQNGIDNGYLSSEDKVLFSPQAYGKAVLEECSNNSNNENVCKEYAKGAYYNTTQGGDIAWITYLPNLWSKIFPNSICTYQNDSTNETVCDGYDERVSANDNPIRFTINSAEVAYEATTVKELLYRNQRALPLTFGTAKVQWKIPCPEGGYTSEDDINTTEYSHYCLRVANLTSQPCPSAIVKVNDDDVCYLLEEKGVTLDGELMTNVRATRSGEHSVTVVGWNDEQFSSPIPRREPYQSQLPGQRVSTGAFASSNAQGIASSMGGFIVQNSWTGPSHSMRYWAGDLSTWDERYLCPNPEFPRNWLPCTSVAGVTTSGKIIRAQSNDDECPVKMCATNEDGYMTDLTQKLRQPYRFVCQNYTSDDGTTTTRYNCNNSMYYYLDSYDVSPNGLVTGHFYAVPQSDTEASTWEEYTLNQLTEREISNTLTASYPTDELAELIQNDPDNCGYHFLPYAYLDVSSAYQRWYAMQYNVTWQDSSYLSKQSSSYNYTLLNATQTTRNIIEFDGPLPLANGLRGGDPNASE